MTTTVTNLGCQPKVEKCQPKVKKSFTQAAPASTANRSHPYSTTYATPLVPLTTTL
jgi:hypothetical protein